MGRSSGNWFFQLGVLFVLIFLLSSQVASSNAQTSEHIDDKKNGNMIYSSKPARTIGYNPRPLIPGAPTSCRGLPYGSCVIQPRKPPRALKRCRNLFHCRSHPHGKAGEFTNARFKDDFHN